MNLATWRGLQELRLDRNRLSGPIPPDLGDLASLQELRLDRNDLSGPIPPELGNLAKLWHLNLASNDLSGPIPPELGGLPLLWELKPRQQRAIGRDSTEFPQPVVAPVLLEPTAVRTGHHRIRWLAGRDAQIH